VYNYKLAETITKS